LAAKKISGELGIDREARSVEIATRRERILSSLPSSTKLKSSQDYSFLARQHFRDAGTVILFRIPYYSFELLLFS
jgi:hypothetical protein